MLYGSLGTKSPKTKKKANSKNNSISQKDDLGGVEISAQVFTLRELAAATKNFREECFLGEGGFGRVYKGRLESTGQVNNFGLTLTPVALTDYPLYIVVASDIFTS